MFTEYLQSRYTVLCGDAAWVQCAGTKVGKFYFRIRRNLVEEMSGFAIFTLYSTSIIQIN
jgi:hypothetical protein